MNIKEMNNDQIIDLFLTDRGLDPTDRKLRSKYSPELIERFKKGDIEALTEILQLGPRHGGTVKNRFSE